MNSTESATETIEAILLKATAAVGRNDLDGLLAMFHDLQGTFLYDFSPPRRIDLAGLRRSFHEHG